MKVEIEFSSLSDDQIGKLLKDAVKKERINSMPVGKRKAAMEELEEDEDEEEEVCDVCGEEDCECGDDMGAKVEMNRRGVKPNLPNATTEDLPRGMNLSKYKKKGKK